MKASPVSRSGPHFPWGVLVTTAGLGVAGSLAWFHPRVADWLSEWRTLMSSERPLHPVTLLGLGAALIVVGEAGRRLRRFMSPR
jgi:hypothetical protein